MAEHKPITPERREEMRKRFARFNRPSQVRSVYTTTDPTLLQLYSFLDRWQTSPEFRDEIRQKVQQNGGSPARGTQRKKDPEKARERAQRRREAIYYSNGN